jgi:peptidoglycan glycosyltransferase
VHDRRGRRNDGVMVEPKLLKSITNSLGVSTFELKTETYRKAMSPTEAAQLTEFMIGTVKSGTGRSAAVSGVTVAGKTGTAEVSSGEDAQTHGLGFVDEDEHPLAVCVVLEKGGSGGSNAAPVAAKVLKKAIALGY